MWQLTIKDFYESNGLGLSDKIVLHFPSIKEAVMIIEKVQEFGMGDFFYEIKKIEKENKDDITSETNENPDTN